MKIQCSIALFSALCLATSAMVGQTSGSSGSKQNDSKESRATKVPAQDADAPDDAPAVPVVKISLSDPVTVAGLPEIQAWTVPIQCSTDGTPFLSVMDLTDIRKRPLYSLEGKGAHLFTATGAADLYDVNILSYFVGESIVGLLVNATRDPTKKAQKPATVPGMPEWGLYTGEHHEYLIELNRDDASYDKTLELAEKYRFIRVAELGNDSLLALAYDQVNSVPLLLVLDSEGKIVRTLELPQHMTDIPQLQQGVSGDPLKRAIAATSMSRWQFATARHRVLLYSPHTHSPVLEVGVGGVTREVPLQSPKGFVLEGVVPSNDRWLMRFRKESTVDDEMTGSHLAKQVDTRPEAGNFALYDVDPNDGALKSQVDLVTGRHFEIACEQDGALIGFSMESGKVIRITAEIGR